ncbi:hypothetical protein GCM10010174_81700 [Kutzneria viridogrisea]|uniref:Secreted protein n=2 Tax=Kutzneria TaxID=43356 RepID=W5WGS6_9PSEU|nr:hypothetical protein [Kutzneria albida]AHI00058.1 hypothetical protein KALB_6699 [Kutzneria albida DSM 43870]MBA8925237.1 hypothetical protein [Kutzneria viridogrisea]
MKRTSLAIALGLSVMALPVVATTATAATPSITCGNQWTQRSEGPDARDFQWGNCATHATKIKVYSLTYGGVFKNLVREQCVAAGAVVPLGSSTNWRVLAYTGEDTATAC